MALVATPTAAGLAAAQRISEGLAAPPPAYIDHGTGWHPPNALATVSYTGASAGGAPGASFGDPGAASAPVPTSSFGLLPILGAIAVVVILTMVLD